MAKTNNRLLNGKESGAGRPSKYTPEIGQLIEEALATGTTFRSACAVAGISEDALADWRRGDEEFAKRLEAAREKSRVRALMAIQQAAAEGDWRAAEAYLRLGWPEYRPNKDAAIAAVNVHGGGNAQTFALTVEQQAEIARLRLT
jgi:hypothetical protein